MDENKKGYFFTLDAVLGLLVLVIGVVLIASSYVKSPQSAQVEFLSDDLLNFFFNVKVKDLNNPYAGIGGQLWNQGEITDGDNSLLQQIGEFYTLNKLDLAEKFVQNVSFGAVPGQFYYEMWIDGKLIYPRNPTETHIKSKDKTNLLLTSKILTFGIINKTTSNAWGPYKAEVFVWEK